MSDALQGSGQMSSLPYQEPCKVGGVIPYFTDVDIETRQAEAISFRLHDQ